MKNYSRRKFIEKTLVSGTGMTIFPGIIKGANNDPDFNGKEGGSAETHEVDKPDARIKESLAPGQDSNPHRFDTMRPIRNMQKISIEVGQKKGDIRGNDNKVLQAAVDYVYNLGGGIVKILPGTYIMRNSLFPRTGVTIHGSGEGTILFKAPGVSSPIIREADWYEYCVQVKDPRGFTRGCGIALKNDDKVEKVRLYTVTDIRNDIIFLDQRTEANYWMMHGARASTRFPIINGLDAHNVCIEDLILDGNLEENEHINGNYAGAVFMQYCNKWNFKNVIARNYNGDGFSFQVCDDIHFEDCHSLNNADLGFHPGSGSQRPVFIRCISNGNSQGFFWCWGACDGLAEDCVASENRRFGFNFGHRDTDNIVRRCTIENNGEIGLLFRKEVNEYRPADRNLVENCLVRNNGSGDPGLGIDVQWKISDLTIRDCKIESDGSRQKIGIRISPEAQRVILERNSFSGRQVNIEDLRKR